MNTTTLRSPKVGLTALVMTSSLMFVNMPQAFATPNTQDDIVLTVAVTYECDPKDLSFAPAVTGDKSTLNLFPGGFDYFAVTFEVEDGDAGNCAEIYGDVTVQEDADGFGAVDATYTCTGSADAAVLVSRAFTCAAGIASPTGITVDIDVPDNTEPGNYQNTLSLTLTPAD